MARRSAAAEQQGGAARALEMWLGLGLAIVLFAMMGLTFIDVIGRYFFNAPVPAAYELIQLAMGVVVFAALPLVTAREQHITISLVTRLFAPRPQEALAALCAVVSAVVLAAFAWRLWIQADRLQGYGERTLFLEVALYPFAYFMCAMAAASAVLALLLAAAHVRRVTRRPGRAG